MKFKIGDKVKINEEEWEKIVDDDDEGKYEYFSGIATVLRYDEGEDYVLKTEKYNRWGFPKEDEWLLDKVNKIEKGRTREEIEKDIPKSSSLSEFTGIAKLQLEIMLDIRDLLQNPPQEQEQQNTGAISKEDLERIQKELKREMGRIAEGGKIDASDEKGKTIKVGKKSGWTKSGSPKIK